MVLWRIVRRRHTPSAFDGEGARRYPGRWNHKDVPVVYCGSSLSLSTLEYFVHVDPDDVPNDLVAIRAELPGATVVETIDATSLPVDWRRYPGSVALKDVGSAWAASPRTVALRVPSVVTPGESLVILNPRHPDARTLVADGPVPFEFDPRMWK